MTDTEIIINNFQLDLTSREYFKKRMRQFKKWSIYYPHCHLRPSHTTI